jgi:hypothetical protein
MCATVSTLCLLADTFWPQSFCEVCVLLPCVKRGSPAMSVCACCCAYSVSSGNLDPAMVV